MEMSFPQSLLLCFNNRLNPVNARGSPWWIVDPDPWLTMSHLSWLAIARCQHLRDAVWINSITSLTSLVKHESPASVLCRTDQHGTPPVSESLWIACSSRHSEPMNHNLLCNQGGVGSVLLHVVLWSHLPLFGLLREIPVAGFADLDATLRWHGRGNHPLMKCISCHSWELNKRRSRFLLCTQPISAFITQYGLQSHSYNMI